MDFLKASFLFISIFIFHRHVCKIKPAYKRAVLYRAPCARRLRSMGEVEQFLALTDSNLPIDLFCFDPQLHVHKEFVPVKVGD